MHAFHSAGIHKLHLLTASEHGSLQEICSPLHVVLTAPTGFCVASISAVHALSATEENLAAVTYDQTSHQCWVIVLLLDMQESETHFFTALTEEAQVSQIRLSY